MRYTQEKQRHCHLRPNFDTSFSMLHLHRRTSASCHNRDMACPASRIVDMLAEFYRTARTCKYGNTSASQASSLPRRSLTFTRRSLHLSQALSDGSWAMCTSYARNSPKQPERSLTRMYREAVWYKIPFAQLLRCCRDPQLNVMSNQFVEGLVEWDETLKLLIHAELLGIVWTSAEKGIASAPPSSQCDASLGLRRRPGHRTFHVMIGHLS